MLFQAASLSLGGELVSSHVLTTLHCQVDVAKNGEIALALMEQNHYDLILMDIGLPDNDGGEVTRRIRPMRQGEHCESDAQSKSLR